MKFRTFVLLCALALCLGAQAAESELVETWKSSIASMLDKDLQAKISDSPYKEQLAGADKDETISQISSEIAACFANAYLELAKEHSIKIEDVFIDLGRGVVWVDTDKFTDQEQNEKTRNCSRNAFSNAGIEFEDLDPQ